MAPSSGLEGSADLSVWEYAAAGGFLLVSEDEDFHWPKEPGLPEVTRQRTGISGTGPWWPSLPPNPPPS